MEEVQSWWEVPAIAHFCYVFKSEFNLFYFEIAELESAILNIQDPDMSISLEQLIIKLLQGFYEEPITEDVWEEKLHELFNDNLDDDENPFEKSSSFYQLTPRQKVEVLYKLCELRLDIEGAMEEIKNIPSEDMQAKIIGKDNQNYTYWYFCDERLYKEAPDEDNLKESPKNKNAKKSPNKKQTREKRGKGNSTEDKPWTVACFNVSDWEKLIKEFSKSRISQEKQLVSALKNHLPLLQESVAEKDRLLRKRYMETAPKRSSSRISKVQAKRKIEEQQAEEEARQAKLEAEKERARKEALLLKEKKESRQKRAEERHRLMEERAQRARLRELAKFENNNGSDTANDDGDNSDKADDSDDQDNTEDQDTSDDYVPAKSQLSRLPPRTQRSEIITKNQFQNKSERSVDKRIKLSTYGYLKNSPLISRTKSTSEISKPDRTRFSRTYIKPKLLLSGNYGVGNNSSITYRIDPVFEQKIAAVQAGEREKTTNNGPTFPNVENKPASTTNVVSCDRINFSNNNSRIIFQNNSPMKLGDNVSKAASIDLPLNKSGTSQDVNNSRNVAPKFTVYKTVIQNTSNVAKWHAAFGSKEQKVHIVPSSYGSASPKKLKSDSSKSFQTVSPNAKSTIARENHIFKPVQTAFITYGKIIPNISSPAIVKLEYRKPPNPPVSS